MHWEIALYIILQIWFQKYFMNYFKIEFHCDLLALFYALITIIIKKDSIGFTRSPHGSMIIQKMLRILANIARAFHWVWKQEAHDEGLNVLPWEWWGISFSTWEHTNTRESKRYFLSVFQDKTSFRPAEP